MKKGFVLLFAIAVLCLWAVAGECGIYSGGSGEPDDPYLIATPEDMNAIGEDANDWDKHFKLIADIDLSGTTYTTALIAPDTDNSNWDFDGTAFTGVFDGNGYKIRGLTIDDGGAGNDYLGLFGYVDNGQINNLGLEGGSVSGTGNRVGGLVGSNYYGSITNCYSTGNVSGTGDTVGGLVGENKGRVSNCYSTGNVSGIGGPVGGLVGWNDDGSISNCYSTGSVSSVWGVGGLVGWNEHAGSILNCYSTGYVSGRHFVGGLVGRNHGSISNCYSTGYVNENEVGRDVGGLVGYNELSRIFNCYSTGSVSGDNRVGGLVGFNYRARISNCYSTGSVSGREYVGGLVGRNDYNGSILNCYSTGDVSGDYGVGGLVGRIYYAGIVLNCFWDTDTQSHGVTESIGRNDPGTVTNVAGLTTVEMQTKSTFTLAGWDFATPIWWIDDGNDYPQLVWELAPDAPTLQSEPETTLWTSNTISWATVAEVNDYYAECAEDANFTSIIEDSGWITDVNCTFEGLELGQRYYYRVKARNDLGIESDWSNVESSMQVGLDEAVEAVLDANSLKNENMAGALGNKIDVVLEMIEEGHYKAALKKLENDILQKTDGCAEKGQPDKNDWLEGCEEQGQVYPLIMETIEYVRGLIE